jgi:GTP-binding protein HflX
MHEILGNKENLKNNIILALEAIYDLTVPQGQLITEELARTMVEISQEINREVSIYVARNGTILSVSVGSDNQVDLPKLRERRGKNRLNGYRCIHTHPGGSSQLSGVDISALKDLHFDAMAALGWAKNNTEHVEVSFGVIADLTENDDALVQEFGPYTLKDSCALGFGNLINTIEHLLSKKSRQHSLVEEPERAMLVSLEWGQDNHLWSSKDSLEELALLTKTAGANVIGMFSQKRPKPDPAYFIGYGKMRELVLYAQQEDIDLCIFDDELSPAQQRNLEKVLGTRVIDRTGLILDIFAQRATTNEGKMQVELAQLKYNLPRIMGQGLSLSRLGGGIGTRGPGETKLEVDRRKIRDRISVIEQQIEKMSTVRTLHRNKREKNAVPRIGLVGYTNAGKSTLLNVLTNSDIYAQDQLFATLDPTTRQLELANKQEAVLTDTVGFIQRLPHQLVAAFKSTLEEVTEADLLLHVVDLSHPLYKEQMTAVFQVLKELDALDKTIITVYNKIDKISDRESFCARLNQEENTICVSAKEKIGLDKLLALISQNLKFSSVEVQLIFSYADSAKAAKLHELCTVLKQEYTEKGIVLNVRMTKDLYAEYEKYCVK